MIKIYKKDNFKKYFKSFGLNTEENQKLNNYPVWSAVLPWENISIDQKVINFPKSVKVDRAKNGFIINSDDPNVIMREDENTTSVTH